MPSGDSAKSSTPSSAVSSRTAPPWRIDRADFVVAGPRAVAQQVEAVAVGATAAAAETSQLPDVSARGLPSRIQIQAATSRSPRTGTTAWVVRQPAEVVEVPVDPGVVVQVVARLQRRHSRVDGRDPAILVVDRAHQHGDVAAVVAPVDRRAAAVAIGLDAHVAVALERILAGGLAQRGQRIGADAGQRVERQLAAPWPRRRRPATACAAAAGCGRRSVRASSISS